jgi:hypothetical protein
MSMTTLEAELRMNVTLDAKIPPGPLEDKWDTYKNTMKLVNPNNKRKFKVIVVGTGLAGASAAATLAELGYQVDAFTFHDSPRRAHSIAAQGGINAAKNYRGDGDSIYRLFYDTIKGGDFRAREANVYRLARVSSEIIDRTSPRSPSWWRRRSPTPKRGPMVTSGNGSSRVGAAIATPHTRPSTKPT